MKKQHRKSSSRLRVNKAQVDDKSFLIIAGGGFLIVLFVLFFFSGGRGIYRFSKTSNSATNVMAANKHVVVIKDYKFIPETITISAGETVMWKNQDPVSHSATANDASFTTGTIFEGGYGSYTFTTKGNYPYYSASYPNVQGNVVVQ